jgi:glycosyltransferase involved in cell wall biosynthesis
MKLLYDHQTFTYQNYGGISRYFYEMYREFRHYPDVDFSCSLALSNNDYLKHDPIVPHRELLPNITIKGKQKFMIGVNVLKSIQAYRKSDFDIFHPTYYDTYYFILKKKRPLVITCHDLIQEKYLTHGQAMIRKKRKTLLEADHVLANSMNTKNDLMEHYKIPSDKITVTYLASSLKAVENKRHASAEQRYFLYVGNRPLYKNFNLFVSAIAPLLKSEKDLFLFCAGGGNFEKAEFGLFRTLGITDKVKLFHASDEKLEELYASATAFFYPSLYEGFGIPLLEAMNCGCPVASSNVSSLPEVAGPAAIYFDPSDRDSITAVAEKLLKDEQLRDDLRLKGFKRAKLFSWKRTALETYQAYKTLL